MYYLLQTYVRKNLYSPNLSFSSNSFRDRNDGWALWHTHLNQHFREAKKISVSLRPVKETLWDSLLKIKAKHKTKRRRRRGGGWRRGRMEKLRLQKKSLGIFLIVEHSPCVPRAENHANVEKLLTALTMKTEKSQRRDI